VSALSKLPHSEISAFDILAPAKVEAFKAALRDVVEQAAEQRLSVNEHVALAIMSAFGQPDYVLHPDEAKLLPARACSRKRIEFGLGRAAAHLAFEQLGFQDSARVLRGENGEPLWPDGIIGSITHCYPWNVAVAARSSYCVAIGVDLESLHRMEGPDISHLICRQAELDWVRDGRDFRQRLAMIFSAKEALYKALYPICRRYIDFMEVELAWSPEQSCFLAQLLTAGANEFPADRPVRVHCRGHENFFVSVVIHKRA
jgi:4'-phosphopantetheinyl transferase EntD